MLIPRALIYAPKAGAPRLRGAVGATGCDTEVITDLDQLDACDLVVAEVGDDASGLAGRLQTLTPDGSAIVLVPKPDLLTMVHQLRVPTTRSVMVADELSLPTLSSVSAKLLWGDVFGLGKVAPWGVRIYSEAVASYDDRMQALSAVGRFASALGLRAKYREAIDSVLDELLMNALYNAPVDASGGRVFSEVDPKDRLSMQVERPVLLQYACDGSRFLLAMRDSFGSLDRKTVLDYLERCATAQGSQIERKASGAGLGLYIVANHVSELIFSVLPGAATEVVCSIDLRKPGQQLMHLGFHEERADSRAEVADSGARSPRRLIATARAPAAAGGTSPRLTLALIVASVLLLMAAAIFVALPYVRAPATGNLVITTKPAGAIVYVSGARRGKAGPQLKIKGLAAERAYSLSARLDGYESAREVVTVKADQSLPVLLELRAKTGSVRVSSAPAGATITIDGRDTGKTTPTLLPGLKPGRDYRVGLSLHGHAAIEQTVKVEPGQTLALHSRLNVESGFARISLRSTPPGAQLLVNNVDTGRKTPVLGHALPGGQTYTLQLRRGNLVPWTMKWKASAGAHLRRRVKLVLGGRLRLTANVSLKAQIGDMTLDLPIDRMIEPKAHLVRLFSRWPLRIDMRIKLRLKKGDVLRRKLRFVRVSVKQKGWQVAHGAGSARAVGLLAQKQRVRLVNTRTKKSREITIDLSNGKAHVVDIDKLTTDKKSAKKKSAKKKSAKKK